MAAPPAVPALPDTERITSYAITAQTGPFDVGFQLYGDGTDYGNWIQVFLGDEELVAVTDWTLAVPIGTLSTVARPIQDAQVTLTTARTGTLNIVGSRRPRRLSQFSENQGVSARDLNVVLTDIVAQNRERWDAVLGVVDRQLVLATQAEAEAGVENTHYMSPLRTKQAIDPAVITKVNKAGDTMTGLLTLSGAPSNPLQAATKQYADLKVAKTGDTMSGLLTLSGDPSVALQAATKQYTDTKVAKSGDTMTGQLTLSGDPSLALQAATKQYADTKVAKTGDTMTGNLLINSATSAQLILNKTAGNFNLLTGMRGGFNRWSIALGDSNTETGSNVGSDFSISRYSDVGVFLDAPLSISRFTGRVTLSGDPTSSLEAATKQYVDTLAVGLQIKTAVAAATTANITLSGEQTIDGVVTSASRVLVKNQSTPANNGIYVSAAGAWARATDLDVWTETIGAYAFVIAGTINANTGWASQTAAGGTIGVTAMPWAQFSSSTGAVPTAGGTMTGPLILSGNPVVALGAATKQYADLKVAKTGDTITGDLSISSTTGSANPTSGALTVAGGVGVAGAINAANNISGSNFFSSTAGAPTQGALYFGNTAANYLVCDSVTFTLGPAKVSLPSTVASTNPTTGALTVAGGLGVGGALNVAGNAVVAGSIFSSGEITAYYVGTPTQGTYRFGSGGTAFLTFDGTKFQFSGGPVNVSGAEVSGYDLRTNRGDGTGVVWFGPAGVHYLYLGADSILQYIGGQFKVADTAASTSPTTGALTVAGGVGIAGNLNVAGYIKSNNQHVIWANDPPFSIVADGTTDDRAALQAAIDAGIAQGKPVRFHGKCKINAALNITDSLDFGGSFNGMSNSILQGHGSWTTGAWLLVAANQNGIVINTPKAIKLHDFFISAAAATTGAGVVVTDSSYINQGSLFDNLFISSFANGIDFENGASWIISNCSISGCTSTSVLIRDNFNPDGGDCVMYGNTINPANSSADGVQQNSAGGLKFFGNKINGGRYGFLLSLVTGAVTSILNITGNSIENCIVPISLTRQGTTGTFQTVQITGNQLGASQRGIYIPVDANGIWISAITITCNSILCSIAGVSIDTVNGLTISDNVIWNSGGGTAIGIVIGSGVTNASVGFNPKIGNAFNPDSIASGSIQSNGMLFTGGTALVDGITAPATRSGYAQIYVDTADGDLKILFGDGVIKTIVTD